MLARLIARDFRNFEHLDIRVPAAGLVIVGENGHGKTSLLEAVAYLSLLRSARGARDPDVVRFGANVFHVRAELDAPSAFDTASVGYERSTKRKQIADNPINPITSNCGTPGTTLTPAARIAGPPMPTSWAVGYPPLNVALNMLHLWPWIIWKCLLLVQMICLAGS